MSRLQLIVCVITLSLLISGQVSATMIFGSGQITVTQDKDYECKVFPFEPHFASSDVRVQLALKSAIHEAAVTWVEEVTASGFTGCVATAGAISGTRAVTLQWMAYQTVANDAGYKTVIDIPLWTSGTRCVRVDYPKRYSSPPSVFLTAIHLSPSLKNKHDAASVWAEEVTVFNFKACLRELKNFDGEHEYVKVDILVLTKTPSGWSVPTNAEVLFANNYTPSGDHGYGFCKTVNFPKEFYKAPTVITTAEHNKTNIDADNNAITEWVKSISKTSFDVCLKDIQRFDALHDPITVNYMALGNYHPCIGITCPFYGVCNATGPTSHECVCKPCDSGVSEPLCDNNDKTHQSLCEYNYTVCQNKEEPGIKHLGGCKPFVLQRGRIVLRLQTTDVQCRTISFNNVNGSFESSRGLVHVQTSINYFNYTGNFVHDAAVNWIENVNLNAFDVCALKAGRAERLTPDGGLTFVDYIAFQEAPVDSVAGRFSISNWWDGTNCKKIDFPSGTFSSAPHVLLTAEHTKLDLNHDAATVWVENATAEGFSACLREMQNFDGLHENIKVNWMAYKTLPAKLLSQQRYIDFPNDALPLAEHHNAYCQNLAFNKVYSSAPTVIVSASHSWGAGKTNVIPEYNSIASWVEQINTTACRVCIKELHNPNGYDPVKVSSLIIGS
ncbi:uncharacterized protein LOC144641875 [Oculina patagonica]